VKCLVTFPGYLPEGFSSRVWIFIPRPTLLSSGGEESVEGMEGGPFERKYDRGKGEGLFR